MILHIAELTRYSISGTRCMDSFLPCVHIQAICNPGICPAGASSPLSKAFFATPGRGAGTQAMKGLWSSIFGKRNTDIFFMGSSCTELTWGFQLSLDNLGWVSHHTKHRIYLFTYLKKFFFSFYFIFFFPIIFISWRLITLQYCTGFCHTLTWISHGFTCVPHPDPPSHLPPHPIPLGLPSAPALSTCLMHPTWAGDLFHTW